MCYQNLFIDTIVYEILRLAQYINNNMAKKDFSFRFEDILLKGLNTLKILRQNNGYLRLLIKNMTMLLKPSLNHLKIRFFGF